MVSDQNSDIFESFTDQLLQDARFIEAYILKLDKPEQFLESVNALFRIFHNHKALTGYLKLKTMHQLFAKGENILQLIRQGFEVKEQIVIDWLLHFSDQIKIWADELELHLDQLSPADPRLYHLIKLQETKPSVPDTLKTLNVLYLDLDTHAKMIQNALGKIFKKVTYYDHDPRLKTLIQETSLDLIIADITFLTPKNLMTILHNRKKRFIPLIAISEPLSNVKMLKLQSKGIDYILYRPISSKQLKKALYSLVNSHFNQKKLIFSNKKIRSFIDTLEPLGETITHIQTICDDEQSSIADLIKVVKNDPVTSGILLNATRSPIYALQDIQTVDQAVTIFGKRTVKALAMGGLQRKIVHHDLSMYDINENTFSQIGHLRMNLMNLWYRYVDKEALKILSTTALLGNIGQLLTAQEIQRVGQEAHFKRLIKEQNIAQAEYEILRTSTPIVSADILSHWKFSYDIIDAITYSQNPLEAVDDIRPLAVANAIVYELVPLNKAKVGTITKKIYALLEAEDLNPLLLEKAVDALTKES